MLLLATTFHRASMPTYQRNWWKLKKYSSCPPTGRFRLPNSNHFASCSRWQNGRLQQQRLNATPSCRRYTTIGCYASLSLHSPLSYTNSFTTDNLRSRHKKAFSTHQKMNLFQIYKQTLDFALASDQFRIVQKALESKGIWNGEVFILLKKWLYTKDLFVEREIIMRRWSYLRKIRLFDTSTKTSNKINKNSKKNELITVAELSSQRELFQSKLVEYAGIISPSINDHVSPNEIQPSFFPMAQLVFHQVAEYCKRNSQSAAFRVAWDKVKESGMILNHSTVDVFLECVCTAENLDVADICILEELVAYDDLLHDESVRKGGDGDASFGQSCQVSGNIRSIKQYTTRSRRNRFIVHFRFHTEYKS